MNEQKRSGKLWKKIYSILGFVIGVVILVVLIWQTGFSQFEEAIDKGGPALLLLTLFYPFELISRGYGWKWVFPGHRKFPASLFILGFWFAQSINILIPTATIGGDILRGKYLSEKGREVTGIITSLLVDKTVHGIATVVILIIGLLLLLTKPVNNEFIYLITSLCVALSVGIYLFIRFQRSAKVAKLLEKWADNKGGFFAAAKTKTALIQERLDKIYQHPHVIIRSLTVRVLGDLAMAGEVWFAAWLMNMPISFVDALALRLISFGVRSAAFFVWGGLGIQEGMYALLSAFVGLSPSSLIVISLATRAQEIITAILGAGSWLGHEGYHSFMMNRRDPMETKN
jgi:putative membrane protein